MIRFSFLLLFFIISCQRSWSNIEINNFLERCQNSNLINSDKDQHSDFCECILEQSKLLELPYPEFLSKKLTQNEKKQIISPCVNNE